MMCNTDYDYPSVYRQDYIKARKKHICSECRGYIHPEEKYQYTFGVWDGRAEVYKTCINCCIPQKWLLEECDGFLHGDLYSEILEHAQEYRKMFLYRWCVEMERRRKNAVFTTELL